MSSKLRWTFPHHHLAKLIRAHCSWWWKSSFLQLFTGNNHYQIGKTIIIQYSILHWTRNNRMDSSKFWASEGTGKRPDTLTTAKCYTTERETKRRNIQLCNRLFKHQKILVVVFTVFTTSPKISLSKIQFSKVKGKQIETMTSAQNLKLNLLRIAATILSYYKMLYNWY